MRRSYLAGVIPVAACAALSLAAWGAQPVQQAPAPAVVWEYKTVHTTYYNDYTVNTLNDAGAEGWEFCGAHHATAKWDADNPQQVTVFVFKRPKVAE